MGATFSEGHGSLDGSMRKRPQDDPRFKYLPERLQEQLADAEDWEAYVGPGMMARFEEDYRVFHTEDDLDPPAPDVRTMLQRVGQTVRVARVAAGFTLGALARATGLHVSNLSRLENGKLPVRLDQLVRIAAAVERSLVDLLEVADHQGCYRCGAPRRSHIRACPDSGVSVELLTNGTYAAPVENRDPVP